MMHADMTWTQIQTAPVTWLCLTLLAYLFGLWLFKQHRWLSLCPPVVTAIVALIVVLEVTGTDYRTYMQGANLLHFLLGPATVALAVPLYEQRGHLRALWLPLCVGLVAGALTAMVSAVAIACALGASLETMLSLVPKSVTVPIAMGISEHLGGIAPLTAAIVVATGVLGCVLIRPMGRWLNEQDHSTLGFATGLAAHGLGTVGAFMVSRKAGAFSGLAMGLTGLFTAFVAPVVTPWLISFVTAWR